MIFHPFSHIYYEKEAFSYPLAQQILRRFPHAIPIACDDYKDVFNRSGQEFLEQKKSPKLILALKKKDFLYKGAEIIQIFDHQNLHYTPLAFNCLYDCEYCYLRGMFNSANIVVFVNLDNYFQACEDVIATQPLYICLSYDTDLLALEGKLGIIKEWAIWGRERPQLTMEVRTKSANAHALKDIQPLDNMILAFSLSPEEFTQQFEHNVPPLMTRLHAIQKLQNQGWQIRLSFEPVFVTSDLLLRYTHLFKIVFSIIDPLRVRDANIDLFRIGEVHYKRMKKNTPSLLLNDNYIVHEGLVHYEHEEEIKAQLHTLLSHYLPKEKIYV